MRPRDLLVLAALAALAAAGDPWRFGAFQSDVFWGEEPSSACVGSQGAVWITERFTGTLVRRSPGIPDVARGSQLRWNGLPRELYGVALAPLDRVLVSDALENAVLVTMQGGQGVVRTIGRRGAGPGELREPRGIAVHDTRLYVADSGNSRIAVFELNGGFVTSIGRRGHGDGELLAPNDVAVDAQGDVYVADLGNQRVVRFAADGRFVRAWGGLGPYAGLFHAPTGIACCGDALLVADRDNHRVQVFDHDGNRLHEWGVHAIRPREGHGKLHYPCDVAVAPDLSFAVVVEGLENRAQSFRAQDDFEPAPPQSERTTAAHYEGGCDALGDLLAVLEPSGPSVSLFDFSTGPPIEVTRFGSFGAQPGRLLAPADVEFDADGGSVWVSDPLAGRLTQFLVRRAPREPGAPLSFEPFLARFARALDLARLPGVPAAPWPPEPGALELASDGELYVADRANARVLVLDRQMAFARAFGGWGTQPGELLEAGAIAVAPDAQTVWVADPRRRAIVEYGRDGKHRATWTLPPRHPETPPSWPLRPSGLALAQGGGLWCSVEDGDVLLRFDAGGKVVATVGAPNPDGGQGRLQFFKPQGLARANGRLVAIDAGNHRFQVLDESGGFLDTWGARLFIEPALRPR